MTPWRLTKRTPVPRRLWGAPVLASWNGLPGNLGLLWFDGDMWWDGVQRAYTPRLWAAITPPDVDAMSKGTT